MLVLGDLLDQEDLGLRLLIGGESARGRPIAGAHNSELQNPSRFLAPDWVLMTTGLRLRRSQAEQRELIRELDDTGLCALGFGVGIAFQSPPAALLDEARTREFPVFQIQHRTPYREIVGFVHRSLLSTDLQLLQRSLSMQNYLLDSLREEHPIDALVDRLARLLDSNIVLYAADGQVEASSNPRLDTAVIWHEVGRQDGNFHRALADGSDVVAVPIGEPPAPQRWLVAASRRRTVPNRLALHVIHSAERLLELINASRRAAETEELALRSELLVRVLSRPAAQDLLDVAAALHRFGIDLREPLRLIIVTMGDGVPEPSVAMRHTIEHVLRGAGVAYLTAARGAEVSVLAQGTTERLRGCVEEISAVAPTARVGVGRETLDLSLAVQSDEDARLALRQLELLDDDAQRTLFFDDLSLSNWLISQAPGDDLREKARLILEPLRSHPHLELTLRTHLRSQLNVAATGRRLNLHQNSVRYRLARIEEIVGRSLDEPAALVDLYLALQVGEHEAGSAS